MTVLLCRNFTKNTYLVILRKIDHGHRSSYYNTRTHTSRANRSSDAFGLRPQSKHFSASTAFFTLELVGRVDSATVDTSSHPSSSPPREPWAGPFFCETRRATACKLWIAARQQPTKRPTYSPRQRGRREGSYICTYRCNYPDKC